MTHADPGRRRAVLASLAALTALSAVTGCDQTPDTPPSACTTPSVAPTGASAPSTGALSVAEQGFSRLGPQQGIVSIGAVLKNTGSEVAYRVPITFQVRGAQGASVVAKGSGELLRQEIPMVLPGQQVPLGAWTYLGNDQSGHPLTVADVKIEVGTPQWLAADSDTFATMSVQPQGTTRTTSDPESGSVSYTMTSGSCRALAPRGVAMVFRRADGSIAGGSIEVGSSAAKCLPGESTESALADRSMPRDIDEQRTQVSVYCDIVPPGTRNADGPIN